MNLKLIKAESCPHCNSRVVSESCEHTHCNGQGFEKRRFQCGYALSWSPNFERLEVSGECTKSIPYLEKQKLRDDAKIALIKFINELNTDQRFKDDLFDRIGYYKDHAGRRTVFVGEKHTLLDL